MKKNLFIFTLLSAVSLTALGQGITTASIRGEVKDSNGEALPGATVIATHTPSGTEYGSVTDVNGRFRLANTRVGGPYEVKITFVGFADYTKSGIYLSLGQNYTIDAELKESDIQLLEVLVSASRNDILNSERTGAATNISNEEINALPTLSRGLEDFNRLTPQANTNGAGISFAGVNNRFNQFSVDGIVNNDVFGLSASGTNGGQTGVEPISLDAIQEVQVTLAPYDVRLGGFAGGGINAVTRSGTNDFEGSAYYFLENDRFVGLSPNDARTPVDAFRDYETGFRLGGPIIKDKLFFFVNGEVTNATTPLSFNPLDPTSGSNITVEEINRVQSVIDRLGYDPGDIGLQSDVLQSEKFLARLDWNLNDDHKITARYSYVEATEIDNINRNPNFATFSNDAVVFPSRTTTLGLEVSSNLGSRFSNNFKIGYTSVRDNRTFAGEPFPEVEVQLGGGRSLRFGSEEPSVQNQLDQDILTISDNFSYYLGDHTFTVGTHNELYSFFNLFLRRNFGEYRYGSLEDFESIGTANPIAPNRFRHNYTFSGNPRDAGADFNALQLGFYIQDEYVVNPRFNVTAGLRIDIPILSDDPAANDTFNNSAIAQRFDVRTDRLAEGIVLWSPRLGFNLDPKGDGLTQVRGGLGIFSSRVPFVWVANQFSNAGVSTGSVSIFSQDDFPTGFDFVADPASQPQADFFGLPEGATEINVIDRDFKYPQVFRVNLAVDRQLPGGIVGTFEGIYTKTLNNVTFTNINRQVINRETIDADGTTIIIDPDTTPLVIEADGRPLFDNQRIDDRFTDIILLGNTNTGFTYNLSASFKKPFANGLVATAAYTWGEAFDVNPGTSSTASSNWQFVENSQGANNLERARADFSAGHRAIGSVSYRLPLNGGHYFSTSLFYNWQSGRPFSYIINRADLNGDGGTGNDLIYIPTEEELLDVNGPVNFTSVEERVQFNNFIESRPYLRENRGQISERNGDRTPFTSQLDGRVMLDLLLPTKTEKEHRIQITFEVFNIGALINPAWGRTFGTNFDAFSPLNVTRGTEGTATPEFSFNEGSLTDGKPFFVNDFGSRWRGQLGLRYLFGGKRPAKQN